MLSSDIASGLRRKWVLAAASVAVLFCFAAAAWKLIPAVHNRIQHQRLAGRVVYPSDADPAPLLQQAMTKAQREHKRILVFLGGNWCQWCLALDATLHDDPELQSLLAKFVVLKLDAAAASELDEAWGKPTRTGVPAFVVLSPEGKLEHAQGLIDEQLWGGRLLGYDKGKLRAVIAARLR